MTERSILVTGASKGIGRAIALRLARDGFRILVHYGADAAGAEETLAGVQSCGSDGQILSFDIADRSSCRTVLEEYLSDHAALYGVVLNAGIARDNAFPALEDADWDDVLTTDLDGFYNVLKPLVMPMVSARKGGRIVALSSVSGLIGNRGQVNYSAAKAGIIGAVKALAVEMAKRAITVNAVVPGIIDTQMTGGLGDVDLNQIVPMRRMGQPEEVAALVGFLCSDNAAYITRQAISVNGGMA